MGLSVGDELLSIGGTPVTSWEIVVKLLRGTARPVDLVFVRQQPPPLGTGELSDEEDAEPLPPSAAADAGTGSLSGTGGDYVGRRVLRVYEGTYTTCDDETTPLQIARSLGIETAVVLRLNRARFRDLDWWTKLPRKTEVIVPVTRAVGTVTEFKSATTAEEVDLWSVTVVLSSCGYS